MSFSTQILQQNYMPIVILQFDKTQNQAFFVNYAPFTWYVNFEVIYSDIPNEFLSGVTAQNISDVGSVSCSGINLNSVSNVTAVENNIETFYFNSGIKTLYIHCPNNNDPALFDTQIGIIIGFRKGGIESYYNNIYYDARLLNVPTISKSKADLFTNKVIFEGGNCQLINTDGRNSDINIDRLFEDTDYIGNNARVLLGFEGLSFSEFRKVFSGYIESANVGIEELSINIKDSKKKLSLSIPERYFDTTTYPDLKDNNIGKPIPIAYGALRNIEVICTNEKESPVPANYKFVIADITYHSIKSLDDVYVDGTVLGSTPTLVNDTTNDVAYFLIPDANYNPGQAVTCDIVGYDDSVTRDASGTSITDSLDIIKDLFKNYYNLNFDANFFNFSHWDNATDLDNAIYINSKQTFIEVINNIAGSSFAAFILEDDGRFAARIFNKYGPVIQTIYKEDILDYTPINYDQIKIITDTKIGYNKDYKNNEYSSYIGDTLRSTIYDRFQTYNTKEVNTLLTNVTDATAYSNRIIDYYKEPEKIVQIQTTLMTVEREIGDIVQVELARPTAPNIGTVKAEVIGITKNLNDFTVTLTLRVFEAVAPTVFDEGTYWCDNGSCLWGDDYWSITYYRTDLTA